MNSAYNWFSGFFIDVITFKLSNRWVLVFYTALAGLVLYSVFFAVRAPIEEVAEEKVAVVKLASVRSLATGSTFTAVGSVSAVSEARLQTESGGRITAVTVSLGDRVAAGSILARLESAAESASLLQAQGSYEAAVAGSAQGNIGVSEAENGITAAQNAAVTTYKNAYTTVSGVVYTTIDQFFSNPTGSLPGVRLGSGYTEYLNRERLALQTSLPEWQAKSISLAPTDNLESALDQAAATTKRVIAMVDAYIDTLGTEDPNAQYTEADYRNLVTTFTAVRTQLVAIVTSIEGVRTGLTAADEALNRAKIAASGATVSSADAQIKIALGSLRAAQANYEKTLVRTPISGIVNALYVKTGEYATPGAPAAIVANQTNGLEIAVSVSQEDSVKLAVGDVVTIDGVASGTIAAIAGAIDPTTGKVALKISAVESESLQNGSTVSVDFATEVAPGVATIILPLSAIKMTGSGPVVFTVDPESKLVAQAVTLGAINGENVIVVSGVTADTFIVVDARGLKAGTLVTTLTK